MEFKKFNSIENSYRLEVIEKIRQKGLSEETFIVQEKAHGSNLSIWTDDGVNFKTAKRTAFIASGEQFYNHVGVVNELKPKLEKLWIALTKEKEVSQLTLYGEIIGGWYPHDDVPKVKGAIKVQKGVYYCPSNEFYAFDLVINGEGNVPWDFFAKLMEEIDFLYAKMLFSGTLDQVLDYPNEFQTTLPAILGLPELPENTCEGVIIRLQESLYFGNGQRIILKNKNEKWPEREKSPEKKVEKAQFSDEVQRL